MSPTLTDTDILDRLQTIFRDVLDEDDLVLTPATCAADVAEWDSLNHVRLMLTVGEEFGVKLSAAEIGKLKNVGDLVALLAAKLG